MKRKRREIEASNQVGRVEKDFEKVEKDFEKVEKELEKVEKTLERVEQKVEDVEQEIRTISNQILHLENTGGEQNETKIDRLCKKEEQLRKKEEQLRNEKEQLRNEKEQLRKKEEQLRKKEEQLRIQQTFLMTQASTPGPDLAEDGTVLSSTFDLVEKFRSFCVAPSSFFTKTDTYISNGVYCGRPCFYPGTIPVVLLCKALAEFDVIFRNERPSRTSCEYAVQFCSAMARSYDCESHRLEEGNGVLNSFLTALNIKERISGNTVGKGSSDGSIMLGNRVLILNIEYKNESGMGNGAADLQNIGYLVKHIVTPDVINQIGCLLVKVVGAEVRIDGAVITTEGLFVDPLTPGIPLLPSFKDVCAIESVARMLQAFAETVRKLVVMQQSRLSELKPAVPWLEEISIERVNYKLEYLERVNDKLMWKCRLFPAEKTGRGVVCTSDLFVCVKFVQKYGGEAHTYCAQNGFAPKLFGEYRLTHAWRAVVMEWIAGCLVIDSNVHTNADVHEFSKLVREMHGAGYVHGDLRPNNIMVTISTTPCRLIAIDFDWSGKAQDSMYPSFMNHGEVDWPEGAEEGKPILPAHDTYWLSQLYRSYGKVVMKS